jgi:uncharacterized protein (DUF488 family)
MEEPAIFTVGYGAREIDDFIAILRANGIEYLLDVRSRPYSRYKPAFSKQALSTRLEMENIRYVFMGDTLGGQPEDPACYTADGKIDYSLVTAQPFYQQGIARLQKAWQQQRRVALMCSEGRPEHCHRSLLIGRTLQAAAVPVAHIDENGQLITQRDVELRRQGGQLSLPLDGGPHFTSRKKYRDDDK